MKETWTYKNKFIVFATEHYNSTGVLRSLGEAGIRPVAIILKSDITLTSKSKYIGRLYQPETIPEGYEILLSLKEQGPDKPFIITSDDKVTSYLDEHYNELKDDFIFFNAGQPGRISQFMDKLLICKQAEKHGFRILDTRIVDRGIVPEDIEYPVITKASSPTAGAWKKDVFICHSAEELRAAYRKIKSEKVLLQQYLYKKNELVLEGFAINHGKDVVVTIASTYTYTLPDKYSYCMVVNNYRDEDNYRRLVELFTDIGFEGVFEVEFLLGNDDTLYFSEINFRNSGWSYASTTLGMNLITLWAEGMLTKTIREDTVKTIPDHFIALDEYNDFKASVLGRRMSLSKWLKIYRNSGCHYWGNSQDPQPFRSFLFSITRNKIRKILGVKR